MASSTAQEKEEGKAVERLRKKQTKQ